MIAYIVVIWVAVGIICTGILAWIIRSAPVGYEDQTGYHDGMPPAGTKLL